MFLLIAVSICTQVFFYGVTLLQWLCVQDGSITKLTLISSLRTRERALVRGYDGRASQTISDINSTSGTAAQIGYGKFVMTFFS